MTNKHVLGIDLGTYNSAAAVMTPEGKVIPISAGVDKRFWGTSKERIKPVPSVVVYDRNGNVRAVGYEAKKLAETEPELAVWGVKRLLAKTYKEAMEHGELDRMLFQVEPDETNGRVLFEFKDKDIRPQDVCAELLRHIRATAEGQLAVELCEAVISVPAYFDAIAVSCVTEAAKLAGFQSVETIPEPVAAALAYDMHVTPRPLAFFVFDLGAGTLDCSTAEVWRSKPGPMGLKCRCKKNTGDTKLGGLDMDDRIVELLIREMELTSLSPEERFELRKAAESAKICLSTETEANVEVKVAGDNRSYRLTRLQLESALRSAPKDLLGTCEEQLRLALKGADWTPQEVERLLLVGGPTAMPCVRQVLKQVFRTNPIVLAQIQATESQEEGHDSVDPMLAVAIGASMYKAEHVTKIHPYGYGFVNVRAEAGDGPNSWKVWREPRIVIPKDSELPSDVVISMPENPFCRGDKIFSVEVIQQVPRGEDDRPDAGNTDYRFLGEFQLAFNGGPLWMQISMRLNENGELETTLRNLLGTEAATYCGVGSLYRYPISLPTVRTEVLFGKGKWSFVGEHADGVRQWGEGFARFVEAKLACEPEVDQYLADALEELQTAISRWGGSAERDVNQVFTKGKMTLLRAQEVKLISDTERYRWEQELDGARERCFKYTNLD